MKHLLILSLLCSIQIVSAQPNDIALLAGHSNSDSHISVAGNTTYIPFDLIDGKILVKARVDGKYGTFMLDTGAPGIVLNEKIKPTKQNVAQGVTGALIVEEKTIENFEWAGIKTGKMNVLALDMSHFQIAREQQLLGLIGYDLLKNLHVLFDFEKQVIILSKTRKKFFSKNIEPKMVLNFTMQGHLPIVRAKIGNEVVYLGLDSGAEVNLLSKKLKDNLDKSLIIKEEEEILVGLNKEEQKTSAIWISQIQVGKTNFSTMKYIFTDISAITENTDLQIDGLLGFPFFDGQKMSINYQKGKIYIW